MGFDPQTCYNNLLNSGHHPCPNGPNGAGSLSYHCATVSEDLHNWCVANNLYFPLNWQEAYNTQSCPDPTQYFDGTGKCDPHVFASVNDQFTWVMNQPDPKIWGSRECDCCCACFAYGTPVAISPEATKPIEQFSPGDAVLTGSIVLESGNLQVSWKENTVVMSTGAPPLTGKGHQDMILVSYGEGFELISTLDQVFLLSSGKLKHASQLSVKDTLTAPDGSPVEIKSIKVVQYSGGIHHIATSLRPVESPDGHLLNTNGVVTGDYALQISTTEMGEQLETGPHIGSQEYDDSHKDSLKGAFHYSKVSESTTADLPKTVHLYVNDSSPIPDGAASFVTVDQAIEIDANATFRPPFDPVNGALVERLFQIFNTFYPQIHFYLDKTDTTPNAYAFEAYGEKHVVISGKLGRVNTMFWQGISLILAQCVASFEQNDQGGLTNRLISKSEADLLSTKNVLRTVWLFQFSEVANAGIEQIKQLFANVKINNGGNPKDPKNEPALACREETFLAGEMGGSLPECAGGPPVSLSFMVYWATYNAGKKILTIAFSLEVDPTTGVNVENYAVTPGAKVGSAKIGADGKKVELTCELAASTNYLLGVTNVTATNGSALDPGNSNVTFSTGKDSDSGTGNDGVSTK